MPEQTESVPDLSAKVQSILDSHFRLTLHLDLDEDIPAATEEIVSLMTAHVQAERDRIRSLLRRASAGRAAYAENAPDEIRGTLTTEAQAFTNAADLVDDPRVMLNLMPARMWTPEENALVDGAEA